MTRCNRENIDYVIFFRFHFLSLLSWKAPVTTEFKTEPLTMLGRHNLSGEERERQHPCLPAREVRLVEATYRCGKGHRNKAILQGNKDAHQKAPHHLGIDGTIAAPENAICPRGRSTQQWLSPPPGVDPTHQATWKNISPLLINGKHFPTPMERKQSSCIKQKVRSQKKFIILKRMHSMHLSDFPPKC